MKRGTGLLLAAAIAGGAYWLSQRQEALGAAPLAGLGPLAGPGIGIWDVLDPHTVEEVLGMRQQAEAAIGAEMAEAAAAGIPFGVWGEYQAGATSQMLRAAAMSTTFNKTVEAVLAGGEQAGFDLAKIATFLAGEGQTAQEWYAQKVATQPEFFKAAGYDPTFEAATIELPHIGEVTALQWMAGQEIAAAYLAGGGAISAGQASIAANLGVPAAYVGAVGAAFSGFTFGF